LLHHHKPPHKPEGDEQKFLFISTSLPTNLKAMDQKFLVPHVTKTLLMEF
jgi:hypothetical protein